MNTCDRFEPDAWRVTLTTRRSTRRARWTQSSASSLPAGRQRFSDQPPERADDIHESIASVRGGGSKPADSSAPVEPLSGQAHGLGGDAVSEPKRSRPFAAVAF